MQRVVRLGLGILLATCAACADDPANVDAAVAPQDAGRVIDSGGAEAAAACTCPVAGGVASYPYDCYCTGAEQPAACAKKLDDELARAMHPANTGCTTVLEYEGCGLTTFPWRYGYALGESMEVYDTVTRAWVGSLLANDTNVHCPADPSARIDALKLRIGRSPDGCGGPTRCTRYCNGTGTSCTGAAN